MGIRIGRVFGIPIEIDVSWLFVFGLFTYSVSQGHFARYYPDLPQTSVFALGIVTTLLFFASLVAHELSHSYFARKSGIPIAGITLFIFGGVARMKGEPAKPKDELVMALAGPIFSLAVAVATLFISAIIQFETISSVFRYIAYANFAVAVFNMIPGFPLDGGRVLRAIIWSISGNLRMATQVATISGQVFAWALIGLGLSSVLLTGSFGGIWFILIGWFLNNAAQTSYKQLLIRRALEGVEVSDVMSPMDRLVAPDISVDDLVHQHFLRTHADSYPVSGPGGVQAIVRLEDVRALPRDKWLTTSVLEIAHPITSECTIGSEENAWEAANKLTDGCPTKVVVYNDGRVVGMVGQEDLARLLRTRSQLEMDEAA